MYIFKILLTKYNLPLQVIKPLGSDYLDIDMSNVEVFTFTVRPGNLVRWRWMNTNAGNRLSIVESAGIGKPEISCRSSFARGSKGDLKKFHGKLINLPITERVETNRKPVWLETAQGIFVFDWERDWDDLSKATCIRLAYSYLRNCGNSWKSSNMPSGFNKNLPS